MGQASLPSGRATLRAVLSVLQASESATGSEIMTATGLARPTVHRACDDLIASGWARELPGDVAARPGRRARRYAFRGEVGHVVGVDLGEHTVRAVVADLGGRLVAEAARTHEGDGFSRGTHPPLVRAVVGEALTRAGVDAPGVRGMTIAVAAPVDRTGRLDRHGDYLGDLREADLGAALGPDLSHLVGLQNDATLAAIGERWVGCAQGLDDVAVVLAGERLGAAMIVDGRPLLGARGAAGELGFAALLDDTAGTTGIAGLTREAGAAAVRARRESAAGPPDGLVAACAGDPAAVTAPAPRSSADPAAVTAPMVFAAAAAGDVLAGGARDLGIRPVARVLAVLQLVLDPAAIVLSGGVAQAAGLARRTLELMPDLPELRARPPRILPSPLGERAVVLGAVKHALDTALVDLTGCPVPAVVRDGR